jgi:hypothetical protein
MCWRILNFERGGCEFLPSRFIPHNAGMPHSETLRRVAVVCRRFPFLAAVLWLSLMPLPSLAKTHSAGALNAEYVAALGAADHFLQAWQSGDAENGVALLTSHAKDAATADGIDKFFSNSALSAYEVGRGKLRKHGRYEFPVVLVSGASTNGRLHRHFSSIVMVNTGNNDWAVDKLP